MNEKPLDKIFLNRIKDRIKHGDFDAYLSLPFMSRELFYRTISSKIYKRIETGSTPLLSDTEIKQCLADTREAAVYTVALFLELEFIERIGDTYKLTPVGEIAVRASNKFI